MSMQKREALTREGEGMNESDIWARYEHPDHPPVLHVPWMERWAYNQMPKDNSVRDLKLMRFLDTDLYQWWGKKDGSIFTDQLTEVFLIRERRPD